MAPNVDAHEEKVRSPAWIYPRSAKLYVDKVEFGHLSLRKGIQSFVEKVDRSLMTLDTYPRIGKPLSKASLALALTRRSSLYILVSL